MNYSPAHIMRIVGISQETFRHWRKVLPPLAERKGRDKFTLGDALALLIVKDLCGVIGIQVKAIAPFSTGLFDFCNPIKWDSYTGKAIIYQPDHNEFLIADDTSRVMDLATPAVVIDINRHLVAVKAYVLGLENSEEQFELHFSPRLVSRRT